MEFTGSVSASGELRLDAPKLWAERLGQLAGKRVSVTVKREHEQRTDAQNRRFWRVLVPVCQEVLNQELAARGHLEQWSKDTVHEKLEEWVLGHAETPLGPVRRRCSQLSTAEFARFCDDVEEVFRSRWNAVFPAEGQEVEGGMS